MPTDNVTDRNVKAHNLKVGVHDRGRARRELSALMPVMGLLIAAMLAKLGVAGQVLHLTHNIWGG
jgi:hypothetical protein